MIGAFARAIGANVDEAERPPAEYASLNEFFVRRLRPGARRRPGDVAGYVRTCGHRSLRTGNKCVQDRKGIAVSPTIFDAILAHEGYGTTGTNGHQAQGEAFAATIAGDPYAAAEKEWGPSLQFLDASAQYESVAWSM